MSRHTISTCAYYAVGKNSKERKARCSGAELAVDVHNKLPEAGGGCRTEHMHMRRERRRRRRALSLRARCAVPITKVFCSGGPLGSFRAAALTSLYLPSRLVQNEDSACTQERAVSDMHPCPPEAAQTHTGCHTGVPFTLLICCPPFPHWPSVVDNVLHSPSGSSQAHI